MKGNIASFNSSFPLKFFPLPITAIIIRAIILSIVFGNIYLFTYLLTYLFIFSTADVRFQCAGYEQTSSRSMTIIVAR